MEYSDSPKHESTQTPPAARLRRALGGSAVALVLALGVWFAAPPPEPASAQPASEDTRPEPDGSESMSWSEVERLMDEQKFQEALDAVGPLRRQAESEADDEMLLKALVQEAQLTMALHGFERSVRFLRQVEESGTWLDDPESVLIHRLFYAQSLRFYLQAYGWEIRQRETTASPDADLDQWTMEQVAAEIHGAFAEAWSLRRQWGDRSLGDLARFLQQNTYPARIRGTLRDSIGHLWVGFLEDRSLWTPEQSNEVWKLDPRDLVAPAGVTAEDPAGDIAEADELLRDADVHPLRKIHVLLAELEAWHQAAGRPEAAFDARRVLISKVSSAYSDPADQQLLRGELESALAGLGRDFPWWSMGQADLAEMTASSDTPWAVRDARDLAETGRLAHPKSAGGQRCAALVEPWEASQLSIQAMQNDGIGRRSVQVSHANVDTLYLRALPWRVEEKLRSGKDRLDVRHQDLQRLVDETPLASWQVELPPTPDLRSHQTYVTPPLEDYGSYVLVADSDPDFRITENLVYYVGHWVTDLALFVRQEPAPGSGGRLHVEVRSADRGEPLQGVDVEAWRLDWRDGHKVVARGATDAGGELSLRMPQQGQFRIVARRGDDSVHQQLWVGGHYQPPEDRVSSLFYTDRAIYRPGQDLQWKVVAYRQNADNSRFEVRADETVKVQLFDANGEEVAGQDVTTNEWGSASGAFRIPTGRALGGWRLTTDSGSTGVQVEEYKRPTFEVAMQPPDESLRFGHRAKLQGEARYYFGAPVTDGRVDWRVTRTPILPYWWHWRVSWWNPGPPQVLASGQTEVEPDGTFRFEFIPEADPSLADSKLGRQVAYAFRIEADVVDPGGETRSGSTTLQAGFVTVRASVSASQVLPSGDEASVDVSRTNLEGTVSPGEGRWTLARLEPPAEPTLPSEVPAVLPESGGGESSDGEEPYRTEGDRQRPRWAGAATDVPSVLRRWRQGEELASGTLRHEDESGEIVVLPDLAPGAYVVRYETQDQNAVDGTAEVEAEARFLVLGTGTAPPLPLLLTAEEPSVEAGGTAEVTVHTGWADQDIVLEIWNGEDQLRREVLQGGTPHRIELPVADKHRGSLLFDATLVRDHQLLRQQATVQVPWTDKKLEVELSSFRDLLRPGAEETWTVTVRDADGESLGLRAAEVLASMYDRSLDHFARLNPASPEAFWRTWTPPPNSSSTLGRSAAARTLGRHPQPKHQAPGFREDQLALFEGYPIGGPGRRRNDMLRTAKSMPMPLSAMRSAEPRMDSGQSAMTVDAMMEERQEMADPTTEGNAVGKLDEYEAEEAAEPSVESSGLRTDFSETAFWEPHLLLTDDGSVSFEFQVPDAVTEWRVWLRALTADFRAGGFETTVRTSKDLLVRPYLPRFFREGDRAELRVVVSNQGEEPLAGTLDFDIVDPETEASRLGEFGLAPQDAENVPFDIEAGGQATLRFEVTAPKQPGEIAVRVLGTARSAGDTAWSDGELRPLPVLPSRLYLSQSRFAVLDRPESRTLRFEDLLDDDDPTRDHESLILTLDGQLLTTVLNALPYLVEYPYSCTEQSLNRFVSTGIVSEVFADHPMVAELAKGLSEERDTQFETWQSDDPNRQLLLEETPWLRQARGGASEDDAELRRILDPEVSARVRDEALDQVLKSQTSSGGFPWWPGGPPSPYMTLYVLDSFSRALESGVEVPKQPVVRAWQYLENHFRQELTPRMAESATCCLPVAIYLNWMLSNFPDESWTGNYFTEADRRRLLDYGFKYWRDLAPRIKGYLALTLQREDRTGDATLVWDSVMDSAKTDEDLGTYWAPEKMAWLWYNDTIETHAFALRVLAELDPNDERRSGLAQWLLVQKKLNHWKSTRATAEVLYSLVHYLKSQDLIGIREEATVRVGQRTRDFVFAGPDAEAADRRQQWVIGGDDVEPAMGEIEVSKETRGFLLASATWHFATDQLPTEAEGDLFYVERKYFRRVLKGDDWTLEPLAEGARIAVGDQLEVQLDIRAKHAAEYVHLRDPRGAGFEPEDATSGYRWDAVGHYREIRDSATNFFFEWLPAGQYVLKYRVRAATAGTFRVGPAQLQSMYAPEFVAYSTGEVLGVAGE